MYLYPLLVVIAASSYGLVSTIIKLAMRSGFSASEAVTSQFFFGFCIAVCIFILTNRTKLSFNGVKILILAGVFTGLTNIFYGLSLNYLPASLAVVLLFQFTWIGMLISCITKRKFPSRIELISLIILVAGTIPAAGLIDVDLSQIPFQGWLWGLAAALCYSLFLFVNGRATTNMNTTNRLVLVSFFAFMMSVVFQSPEVIWNGTLFSEGLWIYGLILGLFGMIIPVFLFTIAVPKVGLSMSSILGAIELPIAVMVSVILLSENVTSLQIVGIVTILLGMSLPTMLNRNILLIKKKVVQH
ncbi:EamA family transporter [Peribacillus butanolivorans]|uniref:EamA/RhaT family transporter n=1 Tax=Peribacillus butanolivorans TaxID=421767 RepID=A0AAX0RSW9_9BACI|nr:DMT family transporter [Peribacillus butanolivorans]KQU21590.1 multidrug transporter [Bacillus sp. Leaf13]KRF64402.1 multidrug transporter [Bacillus sp. Soil768D1]PEJ36361.1 EamA/RhaT family transporter [Peribacillus butanolivorans]QNU07184.1 DMT family transporter [Peribacillus butanolivorans]